jgi:hypothetical protein
MTSPKSFADYAAVDPDEIPEASLLPMGTYEWFVAKPYTDKPTAKGNGRLISFFCKVRNAIDDFEDPDALEEFPGGVEGEGRMIMFYYPESTEDNSTDGLQDLVKRQDRAMRDLKNFLVGSCQLDEEPLIQMLPAATGASFMAPIKHVPDRDDTSVMRDEIGRTAPIL